MLDLPMVEQLVRRSRPARVWAQPGAAWFLLAVAVLALLALFGNRLPHMAPVATVFPWGFLIVVLLFSWSIAKLQRRETALLNALTESVQWEDPAKAESICLDLLSRPMRDAVARTQALLWLGLVARLQKRFDAAQRVYEAILNETPLLPTQTHSAAIGLAATQLLNEQLADAVAGIEKLQRASHVPEVLRADVELVALHQEVLMGHAARAIEQAESRRDLFRKHLSTRAALGYALTAAAMHTSGRKEEARRFWEDATLLMRPEKLIDRIDLLSPLATEYCSVSIPAQIR